MFCKRNRELCFEMRHFITVKFGVFALNHLKNSLCKGKLEKKKTAAIPTHHLTFGPNSSLKWFNIFDSYLIYSCISASILRELCSLSSCGLPATSATPFSLSGDFFQISFSPQPAVGVWLCSRFLPTGEFFLGHLRFPEVD